MTLRNPALAVLLLAPILGEGLSSATPPLTLLLPWNLALFVALYGCGALLVREVARRHRLGPLGFVLLAAAYAVYEEALVDRYWFTPSYWHQAGVGDYAEVWGTSLLMATHLTAFHVAVSVTSSVVLTEALFPQRRTTAWVGRRGLATAGAVLLVVPPVLYGRHDLDPLPQLVAAAGLTTVLVIAALVVPRRRRPPPPPRRQPPVPGWVAFACTGAQFVLTYAIASTGVPWPAGLAMTVSPVVLGVLWLRHSVDALPIVVGVLGFFALLSIAVGLLGRYDTSLLGLLTLVALVGVRLRHTRVARPAC